MKSQKLPEWKPAEHNTDVNFAVGLKLPVRAMGVNFMPSWWHRKHGIEFGERYIFDPDYRVETVRYKWAAVHKLYPELNIGDPDPQPEVIPADYHNSLGPAAMGCEILYPVDNYPVSKYASRSDIEKMRVPDDIESAFPYCEMIRQVKYLNRALNKDKKPFLFKNGILNDALLLRGEELFLDLLDENELGRRVMELSLELGRRVLDYDASCGSPAVMPVCNCTAEVAGPELYERAQLEYDRLLAEYILQKGSDFMIHHCGAFDRFIKHYQKLPKPAMIQIGHHSSLRLALDAFPDALVDYCFSTPWLISASAGDVKNHTEKILDDARGDWHRLSVSIGDLDVNTPEGHVMVVYETMMRYA